MRQRTEHLGRLTDQLTQQLSRTSYRDDAQSSLAVDLAFIAIEASGLNSKVKRMAHASKTEKMRDEAIDLKDAIEHLIFHTQTALPRLNHLIELLSPADEDTAV
jgi:hypothetical protein